MIAPAIRTMDARTIKVAPKAADPELLTAAHRAWREAVLAQAGYRCEAIEGGQRCDRAAPLHRMFADHVVERRDGGAAFDVKNGQCLCGKHHTRKTIAQRAARMAQPA